MSANFNQVSYLRTSRQFTADAQQLSVEMEKCYIDVANSVNCRTIGIFPATRPIVTGESWFISKDQRQQSFRQVYTFTTTASIPHGIKINQISYMTRMYGQYTDGNNWYGLIPAGPTAIAGQIVFYVDGTNIVFVVGGGSPTVTKGLIVLEWLSQP